MVGYGAARLTHLNGAPPHALRRRSRHRELEHRFQRGLERHDPDAIAESLSDDAQFITVNGAWTKSRQGSAT